MAAPKKIDPWHYPRKQLAAHFLDSFIKGIQTCIHFTAQRRKGKTQFLILDVASAAEDLGFTVVYASMWGDANAPHRELLRALKAADNARKKKENASTAALRKAIRNIRAKASFAGAEIGAEITLAEKPSAITTTEQEQIAALIRRLAGRKRNALLLMIDEIQHLGTRSEFDAFAKALRTRIDEEKGVNAILTGSSRTGIEALMGPKGAFLNFGTPHAFPPLDDGFIDHLMKRFMFICGRKPKASRKQLLELFERVERSPFYMRGVVEVMILDPRLSLDEAHERMRDAMALAGRFKERWHAMPELDRLVFLGIHKDWKLYADDTLERFGRLMSRPREDKIAVSRGMIQSSLRRLTDMQYISQPLGGRGKYDIEILGFADWMERNEDGLFD